ETGFAYNWHRFYDAVTGRYTQSDPLGLRAGMSRYGYVGGSPFIKTDRGGLSVDPNPTPVTGGPSPGGGGLGNPNGDGSDCASNRNTPQPAPDATSESQSGFQIAMGKKTPTQWCIVCGAPHGGLTGPYCYDCYKKSLNPESGIPPLKLPIPLDE
ncbi:MAG: hypothetical protein KGO53_12660, partial [Alphaproteobacteria bacterium]|nr:hypothetical protein [Alphaproteobacteria bacterium]